MCDIQNVSALSSQRRGSQEDAKKVEVIFYNWTTARMDNYQLKPLQLEKLESFCG